MRQFEKLGLQGQLRPVDAGHDVHEVLQRAEGERGDLPERRLAEGLRRRSDDARPDVQRQEHRPGEQLNWPQLDDPEINEAMDDAETIIDPASAAEGWGEIDKHGHRARAPDPVALGQGPVVESKNVNGVLNQANASWDLAFTSLK